MSQTFTNSADWSDFFHSAPSSTASVFSDHFHSASGVVLSNEVVNQSSDPDRTTFNFNQTPPPPPSSSNVPVNNRTNRVTKPARKRSRASRRTPTTLLSTDTSNFRAMVQQFTGGPSALGFGIAVDHPQPRRVVDQQLIGGGGGGLVSSSPFAIQAPGYNFHFQQHQPTLQAAYGGGEMDQGRRMIATSAAAAASAPIVKSDGGGVDRFLY